jgi:hypothetical protein
MSLTYAGIQDTAMWADRTIQGFWVSAVPAGATRFINKLATLPEREKGTSFSNFRLFPTRLE